MDEEAVAAELAASFGITNYEWFVRMEQRSEELKAGA